MMEGKHEHNHLHDHEHMHEHAHEHSHGNVKHGHEAAAHGIVPLRISI